MDSPCRSDTDGDQRDRRGIEWLVPFARARRPVACGYRSVIRVHLHGLGEGESGSNTHMNCMSQKSRSEAALGGAAKPLSGIGGVPSTRTCDGPLIRWYGC